MRISRPDFWPRWWLAGLVLLGLGFAVYSPLFEAGAEYIWDDDQYVVDNETLDDPDGLVRIWTQPTASPQYYPLVFTSYRIERALFGPGILVQHLVNVLLHALGAFLLWRIAVRLEVPAPWLGAAIFLVHPLQVESVAWVTERKNTLSFVLAAGATLAWIHGRVHPGKGRIGAAYALSLALFTLGLTAKTVISVVPVFWLLILWGRRSLRPRDVLAVAPFLWLGVRQGLMTAALEREHVGAQGAEWAYGFGERVLIAARGVVHYARHFIWPRPLSFNYERVLPDPESVLAWASVGLIGVALGVGLLASRRIGRGPFVVVAGTMGLLFPALGFVDVYPFRYAFVADHFAYHALAPAALGAGVLLAGRHQGPGRIALALIALGACGLLTFERARVFRGPESLWADTLRQNPASGLALNNLGVRRLNEGRLDEARTFFERSLPTGLDRHRTERHLAIVHAQAGRLRLARSYAETACRLSPDDPETWVTLASVLIDGGAPSEALTHLERAFAIAPDHALGHEKTALARWRQGELRVARDHVRRATESDPRSPSAWNLRGLLARQAGNDLAGRDAFRHAVEAAPERWDLRLNLAQALLALGEFDAALREAEAISVRAPDRPEGRLIEGRALWALRPDRVPVELEEFLREGARSDLRRAVRTLLVRGYLERGQLREALEASRRVREREPGAERARRLLEARALLAAGRIEESKGVFASTLGAYDRQEIDAAFAAFRSRYEAETDDER